MTRIQENYHWIKTGIEFSCWRFISIIILLLRVNILLQDTNEESLFLVFQDQLVFISIYFNLFLFIPAILNVTPKGKYHKCPFFLQKKHFSLSKVLCEDLFVKENRLSSLLLFFWFWFWGTAVVTENDALLWTDGRYFLQAEKQLDENWTLMKDGIYYYNIILYYH